MDNTNYIEPGNPKWVVIQATPRENHTIELLFNDRSRRIFDASQLIQTPRMSSLRNPQLFMRAHVVGASVAWTPTLDIAPETLYQESQVVS